MLFALCTGGTSARREFDSPLDERISLRELNEGLGDSPLIGGGGDGGGGGVDDGGGDNGVDGTDMHSDGGGVERTELVEKVRLIAAPPATHPTLSPPVPIFHLRTNTHRPDDAATSARNQTVRDAWLQSVRLPLRSV